MAAPTAAPLWRHINDFHAIALLCFVGGFIDATGYLGLFGLFTGSITGNIVVAGIAVVGAVGGVAPRVAITVVFVVGSMLGGALAVQLKAPRRVLLAVLGAELAALLALWAAGELLRPSLASIGSPSVAFVGSLAALAMGLQASAVREALPGSPSTNVLTTTLTNCGALAGAALCAACGAAGLLPLGGGGGGDAAAQRAESAALMRAKGAALARTGMPVAAFVGGVVAGAALQTSINFNSTIVPAVILAFLLAQLALPPPPPPPVELVDAAAP